MGPTELEPWCVVCVGGGGGGNGCLLVYRLNIVEPLNKGHIIFVHYRAREVLFFLTAEALKRNNLLIMRLALMS